VKCAESAAATETSIEPQVDADKLQSLQTSINNLKDVSRPSIRFSYNFVFAQ